MERRPARRAFVAKFPALHGARRADPRSRRSEHSPNSLGVTATMYELRRL